MDNTEEARTIGWTLWRVRDERRKSLRVVAGLAGMSKDTLNRIERGQLSPTINQLQALADALEISVSELTRLPVPAPANGHTDSTIEAIRRALDAIEVGHPGGMAFPLAVLGGRVERAHAQFRAARFAAFAVADVLSVNNGLEPAQAVLDDLTLPAATRDTAGLLTAMLAVRGMMAVVEGRPDDVTAPLDAAADLAAHFGECPDDPLGFGFGPTNVAFRRVRIVLEAGDPERAVSIAREVNPMDNPFPASRAYHWVGYGRALAQLREHHGEAVQVLRMAENVHPHRVLRDPFVRDALAGLLRQSRRGSSTDQELRGMARRAGLPV